MVRFYMKKLLNAVKYLHSKGVYHRDIKLENIFMINDDSVLKVGDLGHSIIWQQLDSGTRRACGIKGTHLYSPLEMLDL